MASFLGATRPVVPTGIAVGVTATVDDLVDTVLAWHGHGHRAFKLKVRPGWDVEPLRAVRSTVGDGVALLADALVAELGVGITSVATAFVFAIALNFATSEKKIERRIEHRYAIADPQYLREMSVLLGPAVLAGNRVVALQNGVEIFPALRAAIQIGGWGCCSGRGQILTYRSWVYFPLKLNGSGRVQACMMRS